MLKEFRKSTKFCSVLTQKFMGSFGENVYLLDGFNLRCLWTKDLTDQESFRANVKLKNWMLTGKVNLMQYCKSEKVYYIFSNHKYASFTVKKTSV